MQTLIGHVMNRPAELICCVCVFFFSLQRQERFADRSQLEMEKRVKTALTLNLLSYETLMLSFNVSNHHYPPKLMAVDEQVYFTLMQWWGIKSIKDPFMDKVTHQHISAQMQRFWRCLRTAPDKCWILASIGQTVGNCSALVYVWRLQAGLRLSWVLWVTFNLNLKCLQLC